MKGPSLLAAVLVVGLTGSAGAVVTETSTTPYPGVVHAVRVDTAIPARVHIVTVDLTSAELRLRATAEGERGQRTSDWAAGAGVQVAVNGDLFDPFTFTPAGLALGPGGAWSISADTADEGFLAFDRASDQNHARIEAPESVVGVGDLDPAVEGVVGGRPMLVRAGVAETSFDCADGLALPCERAPRTAVGVSEDGRTVYLLVADGWQLDSLGLTNAEVAVLLAARGAYEAIALDGGGSSSLYVANEGGVVNVPSDGVERAVAGQIGVAYGALPPGTLIGFVRERDVFTGANIVGATVTLDSGQTDITDGSALYSFSGLTPRLTCATASAVGYHSATQCKTVVSGMMEYNSIPLFPNSDFIDAGPSPIDAAPRPDGTPRPDATPTIDAPPGGDGGAPPDAPSACGCQVGRRSSGRSSPVATLGLMLLLLGCSIVAACLRVPRSATRRGHQIRWRRRPPTCTRTRPPAR